MADETYSEDQDLEKKIPVFTVLKNGAILKNIFLLPNSVQDVGSNQELQDHCDINLLVGRHPHCNIVLKHASVSRYHLRIHSNPFSHKLSVIDLESVHGTWLSGKKIEPQIPVQMNEGDTLRVGSSSRVYSLHWVPLSRINDPFQFVPPLDMASRFEEHETDQDEDCPSVETIEMELDLQSNKSESKKISCQPSINKMSPSPAPENTEVELSCSAHLTGVNGDNLVEIYARDKENFNPNAIIQQRSLDRAEKIEEFSSSSSCRLSPFDSADDQSNSIEEKVTLAYSYVENQENNRHESISVTPVMSLDGNEDALNSHKEFVSPSTLFQSNEKVMYVSDKIEHSKPYKRSSSENSVGLCINQAEEQESDQDKDCSSFQTIEMQFDYGDLEVKKSDSKKLNCQHSSSKKLSPLPLPKSTNVESSCTALTADIYGGYQKEIYNSNKETFIPNADIRQMSMVKTGEVVEFNSSKLYGLSQLKNIDNLSNSSEENVTLPYPDAVNQENIPHGSITGTPYLNIDGNENAIASEKGDFPLSIILKTLEDERETAEEIHFSEPSPSSKDAVGSFISEAEELPPCNSYNDNQIGEQESKYKKLENCKYSVIYPQTIETKNFGEYKKQWIMLVDIDCLLNKESQKALRILRGIRGTQLIIPPIVIRELMDIESRGSLFGKSADASFALQWIEECKMTTNGWIRVESSFEGVPAVPTPLSSPCSLSNKECSGSGRVQEFVSPSKQDHILECARFFRQITDDQQIIVLSNDVAMKVKAMSEGIMCETAKEFHNSLVNPFSERFLWPGSSGIGPTWSSVDDIIVKQKYYQCSLERPHILEGLKLLLQNST